MELYIDLWTKLLQTEMNLLTLQTTFILTNFIINIIIVINNTIKNFLCDFSLNKILTQITI